MFEEEINWSPISTPENSDLGTDLLVQVFDERLHDLHLYMGVQVKTGTTYFKHPSADGSGWYHPTDARHADYWLRHRCKHLIVLCDLKSKIAYWNQITPDTCETTGKGFKIFVPKSNTLETCNIPRLLEAAATGINTSPGNKAFDSSSRACSPLARIRTALLAPRCIAPHANRGRLDKIEPEEVIALIAQIKVMELHWQMDDRKAWADLNAPPISKDWRWHFAYALWISLTKSDITLLSKSYECADTDDRRTAALACLAARMFEHNLLVEAKVLLDREIARDAIGPTDYAWLLLHRSRTKSELGDFAGAIEDARGAERALAVKSDDVSAELLFSIALKVQYRLTSWQDPAQPSIDRIINSGDNVAAWWRAQQLSWALDNAAHDQFLFWARDTAQRLNNDPAANKILAPKLLAGFAADHSVWCEATARHARLVLQTRNKASGKLDRQSATVDSERADAGHPFRSGAKRSANQGWDPLSDQGARWESTGFASSRSKMHQ